MKKILQNWYVVYAVLVILVGILAFFCKNLWYIPVLVFTITFHFTNIPKVKWEEIEIMDIDGPGVAEVPKKECRPLYRVLKANLFLGFAGIIALCIDFLV